MNAPQPYRVLFVCTGNSARSILAEHILNSRSHGRFQAFSAGAEPTGAINPFVAEILRDQFRVDPSLARSKPLDEFVGQTFDFIITLCDKARETCFSWPGRPITAHWSSPDPSAATGSESELRRAAFDVATLLATRIGIFTALRDDHLDALRINGIATQTPSPAP